LVSRFVQGPLQEGEFSWPWTGSVSSETELLGVFSSLCSFILGQNYRCQKTHYHSLIQPCSLGDILGSAKALSTRRGTVMYSKAPLQLKYGTGPYLPVPPVNPVPLSHLQATAKKSRTDLKPVDLKPANLKPAGLTPAGLTPAGLKTADLKPADLKLAIRPYRFLSYHTQGESLVTEDSHQYLHRPFSAKPFKALVR
jgi:hypothetical protein